MILDGHPFTVIGITPPGFFGGTLAAILRNWVPSSGSRFSAGEYSGCTVFRFSCQSRRLRWSYARRVAGTMTNLLDYGW
jgi:hypothetical protein